MANKQKTKGDNYERLILSLCHKAGFGWASRTRPGRREDEGDIHLSPGFILQVKDVETPTWRPWCQQLQDQITAAGAEFGALVLKRRGAGRNPPLHLAVMEFDDYLALVKKAGYLD